MSIRVRRPATDRLALSQGDYLIVKQDLTAGEYRELLRASTKPLTMSAGGATPVMELDPIAAGLATVLAYLLDWSFQDADGRALVIADQPPAVVTAALDHLDSATYMEVQRAIQAHQAAREAARADEKKNGRFRDRTRQDFDLCRVMGWTWHDLQDVPQHVYDELVAYLLEEQARTARR